ncbi:hypothetical protein WK59_11250 [Burkholderia ubonensis]|nr:hypothetical protein WK59_11250 [Burkholderia ubonensis]
MFFRIGLQVLPKLRRQCVLGLYGLPVMIEKAVTIPRKDRFAAIGFVQNGAKTRPLSGQLQVVP